LGNFRRTEKSYDPQTPEIRIPRTVIKGGSFLCASNYCRRCRPAARMAEPIDTSTCHVGLLSIRRKQPDPQHITATPQVIRNEIKNKT
jgi:formylglycine-generating enzyme required for sulfatase activity